MPLTNPSFFSINADFAASTATNAQLSLQDTAIAAQVFGAGGRVLGSISLTDMLNANSAYDGAGNYGWVAGGSTPTVVSTIDRIDFNNDTVTASSRGSLTAVTYTAGASNANYSWHGGGNPGPRSTVTRLDFANDTGVSSPRGPLTLAQYGLAAAGNANYGWWAGGSSGQTIVARIDYSNDSPATASARGFLSSNQRSQLAATGNSNYGWWAGGSPGPTVNSTIDRIDYANDSPATASARATLPMPRGMFSAAGNSNYGWFAGGQATPAIFLSFVHRIDFANDSLTSASARGTLSISRTNLGATGNANYGWWMGGATPTATSIVDRIDYSNDTTSANVRGPISSARFGSAGTANYVKAEKGILNVARRPFTEVWSIFTATNQAKWVGTVGTYGWFGGGINSVPTIFSTVDRIDFANDSPTSASPRGPLSSARGDLAAATNGSFGWFGGGFVTGPTIVSTVDRIDFANDSPTSASPRGPLALSRWRLAAVGNADYGWWSGGTSPIVTVSTVDRVDFANDSPASAGFRGPLSSTKYGVAAVGNANFGWFAGGTGTPTQVSTIDRIDWANDSPATASPRGPLSTTRQDVGGATSNSNYGWFGGGYISDLVSTVDRIDFANDTATASTRGTLNGGQRNGAAAGNTNYGWVGGGTFGGTISIINRIDFANDTAIASTRGPLSLSRSNHAATSNYVRSRSQPAGTTTSTAYFPASIVPVAAVAVTVGTFGWFTGGYGSPNGGRSVVDRIDFANDSPTSASPRGQLPSSKNANAAASNANYGWVTGGGSPSNDVFRIDFANDLAVASPRAAMNTGRQDLAAAGNINFGWFGGGAPGAISRVERINYANDIVAPSIRGPLSQGRQSGAAMANNSYGWWAGGYAPGNVSTVDRIDFANDSPTAASPRGALPITNRDLAAQGNNNFGWVSGGNPGISTVYRISYSTDTVSAITRGPLTKVRTNFKGMGSATFGWVGPSSQGDSSIDRIDYSNDGSAASARGNLTLSRFSMAAISNYSQGAAAVVGNLIITTTATTTATGITLYTTSTVAVTDVEGTFGWFISGQWASQSRSYIQRIDFSNDLVTASQRGPAGRIHSSAGGVSNSAFGWAAGGQSPNITSAIDRIDFSNDSPTAASPRSVLSATRQDIAGASNSNYGWFGGGIGTPTGSGYVSIVDRIDFANDSLATTTRGPLPIVKYAAAATSDGDYGWFGGGATPATTRFSIVDRIDFANDLVTPSPRGNLAVSSKELAATGNANYGWFGAGETGSPTVLSIIQRIDYSNDTAVASSRGSFFQFRRVLAAAGNSTYGWFAGGIDQPPAPVSISSIERIDYANDLVTPSPRGPLVDRTNFHTGVSNYTKRKQIVSNFNSITYYNNFYSNSNFGWFGGGYIVSGARSSSVDRIDFANDSPTVAPRGAPLSQALSNLAATGNVNYGWFSGGNLPFVGALSTVNRIDFSNDVTSASAQRGPLSQGRSYHAAAGNNNYAWVGNGSIDRIDYANDLSIASVRGGLGDSLDNPVAFANQNYGWWTGGYSPSGQFDNLNIYRINFANDGISASYRSGIGSPRVQAAAVSDNSYGWIGGSGTSRIERISFANDTGLTSIRGVLSAVRYGMSATGNNNYGWFAGGTPGAVSSVERIDFANDTTNSSGRGPLSIGMRNGAATSNTAKDNLTFSAINGSVGTHGWWGGGLVPGGTGSVSTVDRIDFSNDSPTAASRRGLLTSARYGLAATGNSNYGWFAGGSTSPAVTIYSTVDRIDWSNDSPTSASPRGTLTQGTNEATGTGNANYGWFTVNNSNINRIDYSNDSPASASSRGSLPSPQFGRTATGNTNYGWFAGGFAGPGTQSNIYRIDFSNDSPASASSRGLLSASRYYMGATSNSNYGWWGGGWETALSSRVDRVDFSNDLSTASPRGPLSSARRGVRASGNANFGWFAGGLAAPGVQTTIDRIDYSNDSPTSASPRGPIVGGTGRWLSGATSNYVQSRTEILASSPVNWPGGTWIRGGLSIA